LNALHNSNTPFEADHNAVHCQCQDKREGLLQCSAKIRLLQYFNQCSWYSTIIWYK